MRILGIDPGYGRLGYGIVDRTGSALKAVAYGVIETPKGDLPSRLAQINTEVRDLCRTYQPDCMATEKLFFSKNQTTGLLVGAALGVVLVVAHDEGLPWCEYSPPQVKQRVTGVGNAAKSQVSYMVVRLLGLVEAPKLDDAADALAVAVAHALAPQGLG